MSFRSTERQIPITARINFSGKMTLAFEEKDIVFQLVDLEDRLGGGADVKKINEEKLLEIKATAPSLTYSNLNNIKSPIWDEFYLKYFTTKNGGGYVEAIKDYP